MTWLAWPTVYLPSGCRWLEHRLGDAGAAFRIDDLRLRPGEPDERDVEVVEPLADDRRRVALRVGGHEDDLDLLVHLARHLVEHRRDVGHVERAHVGAARVPEVQEGDVALSLLAEVVRGARRVGEREVGLRDGVREQGARPSVVVRRPPRLRAHREEGEHPEDDDAAPTPTATSRTGGPAGGSSAEGSPDGSDVTRLIAGPSLAPGRRRLTFAR